MSADTARLIVRWPTNGKAARSWIEALKRYGQLTISIERADNLVAALEAAEAQRDTLAKALREIAELRIGSAFDVQLAADNARRIARAALAGVAPPEAET